jgi:hypothetical protein
MRATRSSETSVLTKPTSHKTAFFTVTAVKTVSPTRQM